MLQPNRTKYRKDQKGRNPGLATRGANVAFGDFGLKALERGRITARQIEAARRAITRHIKRGGRVWIRIFPDRPISTKPAEVRMGNGKGNPEYWVAQIQPGRVLYEMDGADESVTREALALASAKRPVKTTFVVRQIGMYGETAMDVKELKELDVAGLKKELNEQGEALFKLRLQKATQQLHNTNQIRNTRHEIARIKTILAQKVAK